MWNGSQWLPFGAGISDGRSLVVRDNGDLIVVGTFTSADGVPGTSRIASWTPGASTFAPLGSGLPGALLSVTSYHGAGGTGAEQIVAGGQFNSGGLSRVASWDGVTWDSMSGGMSSLVSTMTVLAGGDLIAAGSFTTVNGAEATPARSIARWDGTMWHALGEGMGLNPAGTTLVRCSLALPNGDLVVGGAFASAGPADNICNFIARWDGQAWHPMGSGMTGSGTNPGVYGLARLPNGDIVAGGNFDTAGGVEAHKLARWDGTAWHAMGSSGMNGTVFCFTQLDGVLYAGGDFTTADGQTATRFARFVQTTTALADLGSTGGVAGSDGELNNNDFVVFIDFFFNANPAADFGSTGGVPGSDGAFDNNDFVTFIDAFFTGCA